jgi:hypothetical protein
MAIGALGFAFVGKVWPSCLSGWRRVLELPLAEASFGFTLQPAGIFAGDAVRVSG